MVKLDITGLLNYHEHWKEYLAPDKANKLISLSKILCHKVIDNDGYITGISLCSPDDCDDFFLLVDFAECINTHYSVNINEPGKTIVTFD